MKADTLDKTQVLMNNRVQPSMLALIHVKPTVRGDAELIVGTGALYYSGGHTYIISCYHVVHDFMSSSNTAIVIPSQPTLKLDKSHIEGWKGQNDPFDVACMKIKDGVGVSHFICLVDHDLDPNPVDWKTHGALLFGFPADTYKTMNSPHDISFRGFSLVGDWQRKHTGSIRDRFEYPRTSDAIIEGVTKMPEPAGLSGSPVWVFEKTPERIGKYPLITITAIENAWIPTEHVYLATPIEHLLRSIDDLKRSTS